MRRGGMRGWPMRGRRGARLYARATALPALLALAGLATLADNGNGGTVRAENVSALVRDVVVFTKDVTPFVGPRDPQRPGTEPVGYSIDLVTELIRVAYGSGIVADHLSVERVDSNDNEGVFLALEAARNESVLTGDNSTLYIGAAATTILSEREERLDFLPSFFKSGLKVLTTADTSLSTVVGNVLEAFLLGMAIVAVAILLVIMVIAPTVWLCEYAFPGERLNIFDQVVEGVDVEHMTLEQEIRKAGRELLNAFWWAVLLLTGTEAGMPSSKPGQVLYEFLQFLNVLAIIVSTAALTTALTLGLEATTVEEFDDLAKQGLAVCVVQDTSAFAFVDDENTGFELIGSASIDDMITETLDESTCDAAVYDEPVLVYQLFLRAEAGKGGGGSIVGEQFKTEFYGFMLAPNDLQHSHLSLAMIDVLNDNDFTSELEDTWLSETSESTATTISWDILPMELFIVPCTLSVAIVGFAVCWLFSSGRYKTQGIRTHNARLDRDLSTDWRKILTKVEHSKRQHVYHATSEVVDFIALQTRSIERLLLHLIIAQEENIPPSQVTSRAPKELPTDMRGLFSVDPQFKERIRNLSRPLSAMSGTPTNEAGGLEPTPRSRTTSAALRFRQIVGGVMANPAAAATGSPPSAALSYGSSPQAAIPEEQGERLSGEQDEKAAERKEDLPANTVAISTETNVNRNEDRVRHDSMHSAHARHGLAKSMSNDAMSLNPALFQDAELQQEGVGEQGRPELQSVNSMQSSPGAHLAAAQTSSTRRQLLSFRHRRRSGSSQDLDARATQRQASQRETGDVELKDWTANPCKATASANADETGVVAGDELAGDVDVNDGEADEGAAGSNRTDINTTT